MNSGRAAPPLLSVLETALYVENLDRAADFYEKIMGLALLHADDRLRAYTVNDRSVLLLSIRGGTVEPVQTGGGLIQPHDGFGRLHMAFAITHAALPEWAAYLEASGVQIEGTSNWKWRVALKPSTAQNLHRKRSRALLTSTRHLWSATMTSISDAHPKGPLGKAMQSAGVTLVVASP